MSLPKVCVILGAGASHDVAGNGSPVINSGWKPPLVRDLFDIATHPDYWLLMANYTGAKFLTQILAETITLDEISLEDELYKYAYHNDSKVRQAYKYIPAYLRDLMLKASYEYVQAPSNYVILVFKLLAENPHHVLFINMNYDVLLETALRIYDTTTYLLSDIQSYVLPNRQANLLKLHGSTNWFKMIPNSAKKKLG